MKHKSLNLLNLYSEKHIRERNCFRCGKKLIFEDFLKNKGVSEEEEFIKIWNSKYIELFCCRCYNLKMKYNSF